MEADEVMGKWNMVNSLYVMDVVAGIECGLNVLQIPKYQYI